MTKRRKREKEKEERKGKATKKKKTGKYTRNDRKRNKINEKKNI